jgi:CheY-like chemotaxis protein
MSVIWLSIERIGRRWAIKHDGGILGYAPTEDEAWSLARTLIGPAEYPDRHKTTWPMASQRIMHRKPITVLVVEDEPLIRLELVDQLKDMDLTVLTAEDADDAIRLLDRHPEIEVLLTDIRMGSRSMDGARLAHHVRDRWPPIKIIVLSGEFNLELSELPVDSLFLSKPYGPEALLAAMAQMINQQPAPPAGSWARARG